MTASVQQVGILAAAELGDGNLARVLGSSMGPQITISSSMDGFGSATISLISTTQTPFLYALLRSLRAVTLTGYLGVAGSITATKLFSGYFRQGGPFNVLPPASQISLQDASLPLSSVKFEYYIAPNVPVTRLEVLLDVLDLYDVPHDPQSIYLGDDDGGYMRKGINEAGTVNLLDWIRDFLKPVGYRIRFDSEGYLQVYRIDLTKTPARTLQAIDIISMSITPPAVNAPNDVTVSSFCFAYVGPGGTRTIIEIINTNGNYTPIAATQKQDHLHGGAISGISPSVSPQTLIKRVTRTTVYDGGSITSQTETTESWYAPTACQNQQDAFGVVTFNASFDVYQFPDGSWRTQDQETFLKTRETRLTNTFGGAGSYLNTWSLEIDRYHLIEMPIAQRDGGGVDHPYAGFVAPDGKSWWAGREVINIDLPSTAYEPRTKPSTGTQRNVSSIGALSADNEITTLNWNLQMFINTLWPSVTTTPANSTEVFGPTAAKRFSPTASTSSPAAFTTIATDQRVRTVYDSLTYKEAITVVSSLGAQGVAITYNELEMLAGATAPTPPASFSDYWLQPLPLPPVEYLWSAQTPSAHAQTIPDDVRIALAGGIDLDSSLQDVNCETDSDLRNVAFEAAREAAAHVVEIEATIDHDTEDSDIVAVNIPQVTGGTIKVLVWGLDRVYDMDGNARLLIHGHWYPPNILALAA